MEKEQITIDLGAFTETELEAIKATAAEKEMTLEQYIIFLLGWCPT